MISSSLTASGSPSDSASGDSPSDSPSGDSASGSPSGGFSSGGSSSGSASEFNTIRVDVPVVSGGVASGGYDICVGSDLLDTAGDFFINLFGVTPVLVVTDSVISQTPHISKFCASLTTCGIPHNLVEIPSGESSKSFNQLEDLVDEILLTCIERTGVLAAFGGGVIGDLVGFAAGIVRRGVRLVQVPTTLLSQVDSSVGGKTGINTSQGKNLVGLFNPPSLVLIDPVVLRTLPEREMRAGYAEIVKYALIGNHGALPGESDFFGWLEHHTPKMLKGDSSLNDAIIRSCRAKSSIVIEDEREHGTRALLNLGHTFGHALEAASGYDSTKLVHGEAVSVGLALAHQFSHFLGHCDASVPERVTKHLESVGLPTSISDIFGEPPTIDTLMKYIEQDKKVRDGSLTFILSRGIGSAFIESGVPRESVTTFLSDVIDLR